MRANFRMACLSGTVAISLGTILAGACGSVASRRIDAAAGDTPGAIDAPVADKTGSDSGSSGSGGIAGGTNQGAGGSGTGGAAGTSETLVLLEGDLVTVGGIASAGGLTVTGDGLEEGALLCAGPVCESGSLSP